MLPVLILYQTTILGKTTLCPLLNAVYYKFCCSVWRNMTQWFKFVQYLLSCPLTVFNICIYNELSKGQSRVSVNFCEDLLVAIWGYWRLPDLPVFPPRESVTLPSAVSVFFCWRQNSSCVSEGAMGVCTDSAHLCIAATFPVSTYFMDPCGHHKWAQHSWISVTFQSWKGIVLTDIDMSHFNAPFRFPWWLPYDYVPHGNPFNKPIFHYPSVWPYCQHQWVSENWNIVAGSKQFSPLSWCGFTFFDPKVMALQTGCCLFTLGLPSINQADRCWSLGCCL